MASVFDTILTQGVRAGQIPARTQAARDWYRNTASTYKRVNENKIVTEQDRLHSVCLPGHMYMYMYDPKHKDTLPYYDRFPLVFPYHVQGDRFWGINLHYLPLPLRAKLMDGLYSLASNQRYDDTTKLQLSYKMLKGAAKFRYFKPCVKQYLFSQLKSKFVYIYPSEWDVALFMPVERFAKKSKAQVWAESKAMLDDIKPTVATDIKTTTARLAVPGSK